VVTKICVFDLVGKSAEAYKVMQEWAFAVSAWHGEINLFSYQDEVMTEHDFECHLEYEEPLSKKNLA